MDEDQVEFERQCRVIEKEMEPTLVEDIVLATAAYVAAGTCIFFGFSPCGITFLKQVNDLLDRRD